MKTQLTFNYMQEVAQKIFGMQLHRSGSRFRLFDGNAWLGEGVPGCGSQFSLKDIHALFQEWLDHPEVVDLLTPELQTALGLDQAKDQKARASASSIGVQLVREKCGFMLFQDGEQLGWDLEEPWSAEDVIQYCHKIEQGRESGIYSI